MKKSKLLYLFPVLLVACGETMPIKVNTQIVEIPIGIPCKEELPIEPNFCFKDLDKSVEIDSKVNCLLSDRLLSKGYELELVEKLKACKK